MNAVKIGTITIAQPLNVQRSYECAAWYKNLTLDPGTFDVTLSFSPEMWPYWIYWTQPGTVTSDCFDSLFCGNLIAPNRNRDVGKREDYTHQTYTYLLKDTSHVLTLDPEWAWLSQDSKTWRPHVCRLRVLREMRASRMFNITAVRVDSPEMFTVTLETPSNGTEMVTLSVNADYHLIQHDCSGDKDLSPYRS